MKLENTSSGKRIPVSRELFAQEMTVKDLQFTIPYCGTNDEACLVIRHHQGQQVKNFWSNLVLELPPQVGQQIKLKKLKECVSLPLSLWEIVFTAATGLTAFLPFLCLVTIRVVIMAFVTKKYLTALCCSGVIVVTMISFVGKVTRAFHANTFPIDNRQLA